MYRRTVGIKNFMRIAVLEFLGEVGIRKIYTQNETKN